MARLPSARREGWRVTGEAWSGVTASLAPFPTLGCVQNDENGTSRHGPQEIGGAVKLLDSAGEELLADDALELAERINFRISIEG